MAGFLTFAAAAPLATWTATAYQRLRSPGVVAPGAVIGLAGGLLASALDVTLPIAGSVA